MAADEKATDVDDSGNAFSSASDKLRDTAKWLLAALGALGAALIASLSLADLGKASGSDLIWGIVGFGLGLLGTGVAIASVTYVLTYSTTSLSDLTGPEASTDLKRLFAKHYYVLGGYKSVDTLADAFLKAQKERIETYEQVLTAPPDRSESTPISSPPGGLQKAIEAYERAQNRLDLTSPLVDRVLSFSAFERLSKRFKLALGGLFVGFIVASVGIGLYSYFVSLPADTEAEPAVQPVPVEATLDLTSAGEDAFGEILGASCNLNRIPVIALEESSESTHVVVAPETSCSVVQLDVPTNLGVVIPKPGSPGSIGSQP